MRVYTLMSRQFLFIERNKRVIIIIITVVVIMYKKIIF